MCLRDLTHLSILRFMRRLTGIYVYKIAICVYNMCMCWAYIIVFIEKRRQYTIIVIVNLLDLISKRGHLELFASSSV